MKAKLKFTLPEEKYELDMALNAYKMHSILWNMQNFFTRKLKYESDDMSNDECKAYEECLEKLNTLMENEEFNLNQEEGMPNATKVTDIKIGDIVRFRFCMCEVTELTEVVNNKGYDCIRVKGKNLNAEKNKKDKRGVTKEEIFIDVRKHKTINKYQDYEYDRI